MNSVADPQDLDPDPDQCQIIYADPDPTLLKRSTFQSVERKVWLLLKFPLKNH